MENKNIKCELDDFLIYVDGLRNLIRYQTAPRAAKESVAEHSYFVAAYVLKFHDYYDFDLKKALRLALLHDFSEVFISDVPHPVKQKYKNVAIELEKAERKVNEEYIGEKFAEELDEFNNTSSIEGIMVALADILSVASYAKFEMELGNSKYMQTALVRSRERYMSLLVMAEPYLRKGIHETHDIIGYIENFLISKYI
jgi:5'-deoxynucleotidase YfbR-like HD superfamily hydrolase